MKLPICLLVLALSSSALAGPAVIWGTTPGGTGAAAVLPANLCFQDGTCQNSAGAINPSYGLSIIDYFIGYSPSSDGSLWNNSCAGTGCKVGSAGGLNAIDNAHPGLIDMQTGTTTTGYGLLFSGNNLLAGGGAIQYETLFQQPTVCDSVTDVCQLTIGLTNTYNNDDPSSYTGVYFQWAPGVNSGNWTTNSCVGGSCVNDSPTTAGPVSATWMRLNLSFTANGGSVMFLVNNVLIDTITSVKIPTTPTNSYHLFYMIKKSAGTNNRELFINYVKYVEAFTTAR